MLQENTKGLIIDVKVQPKAKNTKIVSWENDVLKIQIKSPPDKGKANEELLDFFKKNFFIRGEIFLGKTSSRKKILLPNTTKKDFLDLLSKHLKKP